MAQDANASTVIATVNGTQITLGEMIIARAQLPQQYAQLPDDILFRGVLDQLIQQQLLGEALEATPARVDYALRNERRSLLAGETIDALTRSAVTEDALQAAYAEKYADAEPSTEYNAAHLLVETQEAALAARARIVDEGQAFADVARDVSTGPTGPNGGNLGWFGEGQMVAEFEATVKAIEIGDVSEPVQTQFGWHVVTLLETRNQAAPEFDEVRQELFGQVQEAAIQELLSSQTEAAEITRPADGDFDATLISNLSLLEE